MGDRSRNMGVQVFGGEFRADTVAIGPQATATKIDRSGKSVTEPCSIVELKERLEDLLELLEAHGELIPDSEKILESARAATEEVSTQRPRKGLILGLLKNVSSGVGSVVELAGVVGPLIDAAARLIH